MVILAVLAVPLVPFALLGDQFEAAIERWLSAERYTGLIAAATVGLLASDVILPVPSSFVSTLAGAKLGIVAGTAASWLGMTIGAAVAFVLARWLGRPLARRLAHRRDVAQLEALGDRLGASILVTMRALPVLAEASVLAVGVMGVSWRRFWPAVSLANLGIALAYSLLGAYSVARGEVLPALLASIALPLAATLLARGWIARRTAANE